MDDLRSIKEKIKKLKSVYSINVVGYEDDILICYDEIDNKVKSCEFLDKGRICYVKIDTYLNRTSSVVGRKKR
jgi:hypothetical protein